MGGGEGVINVDIGQSCQGGGIRRAVFFLPGVKAEILQQHYLPRFETSGHLLNLSANAVRRVFDLLPE